MMTLELISTWAGKIWKEIRKMFAQSPPPHTYERIRRPYNKEDQLYLVANNSFNLKRIMNKGEFKLFQKIERHLTRHHPYYRVFPQVCLGEIFTSENKSAYSCINSKRADLIIIDQFGRPIVVIEYQGEGHFNGDAIIRDAVKKEVCRKTGVAYMEFSANDEDSQLLSMSKLLASKKLVSTSHNQAQPQC